MCRFRALAIFPHLRCKINVIQNTFYLEYSNLCSQFDAAVAHQGIFQNSIFHIEIRYRNRIATVLHMRFDL